MILKKLHIASGDKFALKLVLAHLRKLGPGNYRVYITNDRKQRSLEQNAYYWAVVVKVISDYTGYTTDQTHKKLKYMFNPEMFEVWEAGKLKMVKDGRSTTELNTKEFEEYLEQIRVWAWETFQLEIPAPGEFTEDQLIEFDSEHN